MKLYRSFAKINLHLQIVGRRPDGYHELRTVFQTIDLADDVEVELGGAEVAVEVAAGEAPAGPENLAWRAARAFLDRWAPGNGARVRLTKRIPSGGGLGGGSSNAATVLLALRELVGSPHEVWELWPLAHALGADVPYFLTGGTALGIGRGDEVIPLPDLPARELILVIPRERVSTPEAFSGVTGLTGAPLDPRILAIAQGGSVAWDDLEGTNDLESAVFARWPGVAAVHGLLLENGASWARLSGSGAAVFGRFDRPVETSGLEARLPSGCRVERVRTLGRLELARRRGGAPSPAS